MQTYLPKTLTSEQRWQQMLIDSSNDMQQYLNQNVGKEEAVIWTHANNTPPFIVLFFHHPLLCVSFIISSLSLHLFPSEVCISSMLVIKLILCPFITLSDFFHLSIFIPCILFTLFYFITSFSLSLLLFPSFASPCLQLVCVSGSCRSLV